MGLEGQDIREREYLLAALQKMKRTKNTREEEQRRGKMTLIIRQNRFKNKRFNL